ncbi:mannosyltransferase [Xanthomarina sp. F2636L]|uniref:mannosyltransferase n=1 Tax=Xanthomarina sp. F2636L TaxID=2996018 RepID=UPI00225DDA31|nr:mannosyltransferase [Xanthomarina sp. F2636L]MCX7550913.1 mannosyltransferase [Xanthomarina sp. F2636L]
MLINPTYLKLNKIPIIFGLISMLFYGSFAYNLQRTDSIKLITLYLALFFLFYKLVQINKSNLKFLTLLAFAFRAVFILAIPNLSQDFYRFIWDGRLILEGINPYLFTPDSYFLKGEFPFSQAKELHDGMGSLSASHFSNYPPLNQLCFALANLIPGQSILSTVIGLRILIIAADFGTLYFGKKLLKKLKLPTYSIFWYLLNPFIIIELTGNLHFEGVMIFFLVLSLYLLQTHKWKLAAVIFACSVSIKLIPLIFLPLVWQWFIKPQDDNISNRLKIAKLIGFYSIVGIVTLVLFLPFYSSEFIDNYAQTVGLWFQNFEFNGSLYYIARELGYIITGYNQIAIIGTASAILVFVFVIGLSLFRKNASMQQLITAMLFVLSFYYFTATTVHPWYLATLLFLSVFTKYKFPLVWSLIIILSYLAYANPNNLENLWLIALEYIIVYSVFLYEIFKTKSVENKFS